MYRTLSMIFKNCMIIKSCSLFVGNICDIAARESSSQHSLKRLPNHEISSLSPSQTIRDKSLQKLRKTNETTKSPTLRGDGQIYRNMLSRTPRFIETGLPSSSSAPDSPPSPALPSIAAFNSSSS